MSSTRQNPDKVTASTINSALAGTLTATGAPVVLSSSLGKIQAQADTGTTVGGNARGTKAVDLQKDRASASQVAGGTRSTILNGINNGITGSDNSIVGGQGNTITNGTKCFVGGGETNTICSGIESSSILGGAESYLDSSWAVIGGGDYNYLGSNSDYAVVGGGRSNSLSGGFSVICGGLSNYMEGSFSFIGGGGNNAIHADNSVVCGGSLNEVNAYGSVISGGQNNSACGLYSWIPGGAYAKATMPGEGAYSTSRLARSGDTQRSLIVLSGLSITSERITLGVGSEYDNEFSEQALLIGSHEMMTCTMDLTGLSNDGATHGAAKYFFSCHMGPNGTVALSPVTVLASHGSDAKNALPSTWATDVITTYNESDNTASMAIKVTDTACGGTITANPDNLLSNLVISSGYLTRDVGEGIYATDKDHENLGEFDVHVVRDFVGNDPVPGGTVSATRAISGYLAANSLDADGKLYLVTAPYGESQRIIYAYKDSGHSILVAKTDPYTYVNAMELNLVAESGYNLSTIVSVWGLYGSAIWQYTLHKVIRFVYTNTARGAINFMEAEVSEAGPINFSGLISGQITLNSVPSTNKTNMKIKIKQTRWMAHLAVNRVTF